MAIIISKLPRTILGIFASLLIAVNLAYADDITVIHDLSGFEKVRINNVGLELEIKVGEAFEIIVDGHEVNVNNLVLDVEGDTLVIHRKDGKRTWNRRGNSHLEVEIKMPKFSGLELRGAVDAEIEGVDSDLVEFDLKGAGNIEIEGRCKKLTVELKGAGNFEAEDLECEEVDVELSGAGNIEVYASREINAEINGIGNIDVFGDPEKVTRDDGWLSNISIH